MKVLSKKSDTHGTPLRLSGKSKRLLRDNMYLFMLALPGVIFLLIFSYMPMFGLVMAFKDFVPRKGLFGSEWCGLDNFKFFFTSQDALRTIRNTVLYAVDFLVVDLVVGVVMALLLFHLKNRVALKFYHSVIMVPRFLSIIIIAFMTYSILSPSYGILNTIIKAFGGEGVQWYSDPAPWPWILNIVHIWQIAGSGCLYYYAGLMSVDNTLFEAAEIDGANTLQKCWHISVPALIPIITMMTILGIGGLFSGDMGLFYQVPKDQGVLYPATDIINTYTYRALLGGSLEKSSAVGLFQSLTGLVLVLTSNAIIRKVSPENAMF